jgi:hypothetical protein
MAGARWQVTAAARRLATGEDDEAGGAGGAAAAALWRGWTSGRRPSGSRCNRDPALVLCLSIAPVIAFRTELVTRLDRHDRRDCRDPAGSCRSALTRLPITQCPVAPRSSHSLALTAVRNSIQHGWHMFAFLYNSSTLLVRVNPSRPGVAPRQPELRAPGRGATAPDRNQRRLRRGRSLIHRELELTNK